MTSLLTPPATIRTLADLLDRLGGISAERVRFHPAPGTATEADVIEVGVREGRHCELVDGVLVEKAMGLRESLLAVALGGILRGFVIPRNLGLVSGADGTVPAVPGTGPHSRRRVRLLGSHPRSPRARGRRSRTSCPTWPSRC